jgi:hypothetical protein
MRYFAGIMPFFLVLFFVSCGPSQEDRARVKLNRARVYLQNRDTANALLELDSISILYTKAPYATEAANVLKNEIQWDILRRLRSERDSVHSVIGELEKNFIREKTEYDRYARYTHKRQQFDNRWDKSYLRVILDERGMIWFSSNYFGEEFIHHTAVRVYDGPDQAKTETVEAGDVNNHRSDFMDGKWEKVTYREGKENNVIEFIANHTERRLKAVFLGERYYYIVLEEYDKRVFQEALRFSEALKKQHRLEDAIKRLQEILNAPD